MPNHSEGDLNDLERRLSALTPARDGLNADAMLFAAGRASARPTLGRIVWPTLALCFAVLACSFGRWGWNEHLSRVALAQQLQKQLASVPVFEPPVYEPPPLDIAPDSYLSALRAIRRDETWPREPRPQPHGPRSPAPPPLHAWPAVLDDGP